MTISLRVVFVIALTLTSFFFAGLVSSKTNWPKIESIVQKDPAVEKRIQDILSKMSLEQKIGQMVQAEIKHASPEDVKKYHLGSILNGGGSFPNNNKYSDISDWVKLADKYFNASTSSKTGKFSIPVIWGTDAVHGHNNIYGATIFPHNIGLGAANNPSLMKEIGQATALEVLSTGIDWVFAPTVAVVRNDRWGRTYEGYSESPAIVKSYAGPIVKGLQGDSAELFNEEHLISTVKHFVGDGGTLNGVDQGDNRASEDDLLKIHAQGYLTGLAAGAQTVMASFNSWKGDKVHGNKYLLTEVLKNKMGFDGFVIGDWNGHGQVTGCNNSSCAQAINAGVDMIMVPQDWKAFIKNTIAQVKSGEITEKRINDAVTRILRVKIRGGLFEKGAPSTRKYANDKSVVGSKKHRDIARQAVRESLVLLKNKNGILPLSPKSNVLVTGSGADDIGRQSGGWTLTWQGTGNQNSDFPGATSIFDGIQSVVDSAGGNTTLSLNGMHSNKPDVAIIVFGETPYAEGQGDISDLYYGLRYNQDLALLKSFKDKGIPVVSVFITGRPLWVNPELNASDAFVVAWLPGSEGAGISDVLFKTTEGSINYDFKGKLSFSWPKFANQFVLNQEDKNYKPLFSYGYGLTYKDTDTLSDNLAEVPFPGGSIPEPKDKVTVFKGRTSSPFVNYVGDFQNWKFPLAADVGSSAGGLVKVIAIDKDIQEDARQITFVGGDSNYYFQSQTAVNINSFLKTQGVLKLDLRVDKRPTKEANVLMGLSKLNLNKYLNSAKLGQWKTVSIKLECFKDRGADFSRLDMPLSLATFGTMKLSVANIEVLAKPATDTEEIQCK